MPRPGSRPDGYRDDLCDQLIALVKKRHPRIHRSQIVISWLNDGRPAASVVGKGCSYTLPMERMLG